MEPHVSHRTTVTAMIVPRANLPAVGIITSRSSSSYLAATVTTRHSPMMSLPGQCGTTPIWHGGCQDNGSNVSRNALPELFSKASAIVWCLVHYIMYSYVGLSTQQPPKVCQYVVT